MFSESGPEGGSMVLVEPSEEPLESLAHALKDLLFRIFLHHQESIRKSRVKGSMKIWLQLVFIGVNTMQVLSVTVEYVRGVTSYESYRYFEQVAKGVRPDLWVLGAEQATVGVLVSLSILVMILCAYTLETILEFLAPRKKLSLWHDLVIDLPLFALQRFLFIPLTLFYFRVMKMSLFESDSAEEQFQGVWKGILCIPGLLGFYLFLLLRVCFVYDNAWMLRSHRLLAHVDHVYELKECLLMSILCLISILETSPLLSLLMSAVLNLYLFLQLVWFVPYYHDVTLLFKSLEFGICSWAGISGFAGIVTDSMTVTAKLFIFVAPCLGFLIAQLLSWRVALVNFERVNGPFWRYELAIRKKLATQSEEDTGVDNDLKQAIDFGAKLYAGKYKEYYLLVAHYYYYVRDEAEIALVRMTSAALCPGNLFAEFQIYRFSQSLCRLSASEEREFVDYQSLYQKSRALDCKLCEMTYDLLNILVNKNTNETLLERSFLNLAKVIQLSQFSYQRLKSKFQNDPFVLQSYGTFIGDLFHEPMAQDLITRGFFELNRRKKTHINTIESYSSVDTGVMIISCHPKLFGKITFANDQLGKILGCKINEIVGKDLDDFIPPPYNYKHNNKLVSFLARGEAKEIFRSHLFLSSSQRFSVEVTFRFRPTVVQGTSYFVVAVRPKPNTREFAIFDGKFSITSHSLYFPTSISINERKSLVGESLEALLPGVMKMQTDENANGFMYYHPESHMTLGLKYGEVALGKGVIHWLYVITSERGIDDLFTNRTGEDIASFKKTLKGSTMSSDDKQTDEFDHSEVNSKSVGITDQRIAYKESSPTLNKETKEEVTAATSVLTSYAKSMTGLAIRRQANRAVNTLKVSYLVMILLMSVFIAISLAVLYATFQSISQSTSLMDLGMSRLYVVRTMHLCRRINLIAYGYEPESSKEALQSRLKTEISSLNAVMEEFLQYDSEITSVFTLIDNKFSQHEIPLITALTDFNMHAQFQADTFTTDPLSSDFFYNYYNGISLLMHSLNCTVDTYLGEMEDKGVKVIILTSAAMFIMMALVLVGSNLCIAKSVYDLEKCYGKMWKIVVSVPPIRAREIMNVHKDRIELVHGTEYIPVEQSKLRQNKSILHPPKRRSIIIAKVSLFAMGSGAFILFLLFYGYSQIHVLLGTNEGYVNLVSYSTLMPTINLHLLKELYLSLESDNSYFKIIREGQHIVSLDGELKSNIEDMARIEDKILSNMGEIEESRNYALFTELDLSFSGACRYLNSSTSCEGTSLAKGQHPSITELRLLLWDYANRINHGVLPWSNLQSLEDYIDMLTEATVLLLQQTQEYAAASSKQFASDMLTYSCIYVMASGLLYGLLYLPTIRALKQQCISLWRITTLIRVDYIAQR